MIQGGSGRGRSVGFMGFRGIQWFKEALPRNCSTLFSLKKAVWVPAASSFPIIIMWLLLRF